MADKSVTIKGATDKQLDELLIRLRKENELQNLIADLKRKSDNEDYSYRTYDRPQISTEQPIESLYHFGIRGMKWGVRRQRGANGRVTSKPKSPGSKDYIQSRKLKGKGHKKLSTQELRDLTQRLQLERQFHELNPKKYKKAMSLIKEVTAAGTTVASLYALSKTPLGQDVIKAVSKRVG